MFSIKCNNNNTLSVGRKYQVICFIVFVVVAIRRITKCTHVLFVLF